VVLLLVVAVVVVLQRHRIGQVVLLVQAEELLVELGLVL
jgi:hypothetical protein